MVRIEVPTSLDWRQQSEIAEPPQAGSSNTFHTKTVSPDSSTTVVYSSRRFPDIPLRGMPSETIYLIEDNKRAVKNALNDIQAKRSLDSTEDI